METGPLKAGVAEMELDPPLGLAMGDGAPRAEGSLTPLYAKALVLSNGHAEVAIVTLDMLAIDGPDANRAAELVERRCGVPAGAIIMTCSHTHVAPSMLPTLHAYRKAFGPQFDDEAVKREREWVDVVVDRIADAVSRAHDSLRPATLGVATADLPWAVFNRRRRTRNYGVWTHWMGIPPDQAYRPEGPVDPELGVLVVRGADHRPICLLWNMTGHNSFNFGDKYSGGLEKATEEVASAIMAVQLETSCDPLIRLSFAREKMVLPIQDYSEFWSEPDVELKHPGALEAFAREAESLREEGAEGVEASSSPPGPVRC